MSHDDLGLFDTPPTRRQVRFSSALAILLVVTMLAAFAIPNVRLREITPIVPTIDSIMFLSDLIVATLLYIQATVFRSRALTVLASTFVFIALLLVTHMLTFPGVFGPDGVLGGGLSTTAWTYILRRAALPLGILLYVVLRQVELSTPRRTRKTDVHIWLGVLSAVALAAAATALVTLGNDLFPPLFVDRYHPVRGNLAAANLLLIAIVLAAMVALFVHRRSVLDMWLLVALVAWLIMLPLNMRDWGRFTVGFYTQWSLMPLSNLILMLALLAESGRLYTKLALSTAARHRERDARLTSVEAVAATFSHEIGQPLSAVSTNTMAGLSWLDRPQPNLDKAIEALRGALDATGRVAGVVKSLRAMIVRETGTVASFGINELAWQTTELLQRELTAARVALRLEFADGLPPVEADRVQVQQVLVNLLMNAIESLGDTRKRQRRITIRSSLVDDRAVLLEISDTGLGLFEGDVERIFEPFVTTKATGTGLGLAICRSIAEQHGGRLWASLGKEHGATFHLELPCTGASAPAAANDEADATAAHGTAAGGRFANDP